MEESMSPDKIPQTDSIRELAQFWDTHDLADFEDQLEEVAEPVFEREKVLRIRLPDEDVETVESMARSRGLDPADLIRRWIREKLNTSS
jgi:predicted DNA binding CopG/RHH family protein